MVGIAATNWDGHYQLKCDQLRCRPRNLGGQTPRLSRTPEGRARRRARPSDFAPINSRGGWPEAGCPASSDAIAHLFVGQLILVPASLLVEVVAKRLGRGWVSQLGQRLRVTLPRQVLQRWGMATGSEPPQ